MAILVGGYTAVADRSRLADDPLQPGELGALLAALDEGAALLSLGGSHAIDQQVLRIGMRRLLTPGSTEAPTSGSGDGALHHDAIRHRFADAISAWRTEDDADADR